MNSPDNCFDKHRERPGSNPRAVHFSSRRAVCQGVMRVEGVEVEFPADVAGAVGAQDVEGEGAEPGEVARFGANAAMVFEEADIADVMASVAVSWVGCQRPVAVSLCQVSRVTRAAATISSSRGRGGR